VVHFQPSYKATAEGLLVEHFVAHLRQTADPQAAFQEMRVGIEYQTIDGFPIPARLNMEVVGTGILNSTLGGCTVSRVKK
jgi:hypothetical protein